MKHAEILDLLEAALALIRSIQTANDTDWLAAHQRVEASIGLLQVELKALKPPEPHLMKRLVDCAKQILTIDMEQSGSTE
ncbi:hypothetical protein [Rubrivivax sp. A210]|uniref:hypothetical protein n=1 Tax=Rubrivivax sp. A210 TaxID=2772301 RepID=UPI00191878D1|nr:hypothetical protein [Rubrivivax sp. A210]